MDVGEVAARLEVRPERGLSEEEAAARLASHGPNELEQVRGQSPLGIFVAQFRDVLILILLAAAGIAALLGELSDAVVIGVIVALNAIIGTVQEYRAEKALSALRRMSAPEVSVRRGGHTRRMPGRGLVPGDVVALEAGNVVPADVRLVEVADLQVDESALTGESVAVDKSPKSISAADVPLGDRRNMAYKGTNVTRGHGHALVVATGMYTELGGIARLIRDAGTLKTPLQQRLARFSRRLAVAVLGIVAVVFAAGLIRGEEVLLMFLTSVSLAVAAIPEALPAVVTISLALGAQRMSRRQALIRRLPAVESLGSVTWICSDKTGTLTKNRMHVEVLYAAGTHFATLSEIGAESALGRSLGHALALCTDVVAGPARAAGAAADDDDGDDDGTNAGLVGDPTEVALYLAARAAGYDKAVLEREQPRVAELAFDAERRAMSTLHDAGAGVVAYVKGAPEALLPRCVSAFGGDDGERAGDDGGLGELDLGSIQRVAEELAARGYRVLALARRTLDEVPAPLTADVVETELELLGLVGLIDPPRDEVPQAIADCQSAGITPVMITGDHPGTARAIAARLGIAGADGEVLTGRDLDAMSEEELAARVLSVRVYARVNPAQKIAIVRALQARGQFVAMTGDGVNDAPALKRADIGVAMGQGGTDVAREAGAMILLDDDFATIVGAVREGRRIFDNIRKFIKYTMTSNAGEIWTLLLAPFFGLPLPLLPIHILWVNLVTDGLPGLALAAEPGERGLMQRPPRPPGESIFAHGMWQHMVWVGLLIGALSIGTQAWGLASGRAGWQTMVFTVLTLSQLAHAMVVRSERESLFSQGLLSNRPLLGAVGLTVGLQLAVIYLPGLNAVFRTQPLSALELAACFAPVLVVVAAVEIEKAMWRRRDRSARARQST